MKKATAAVAKKAAAVVVGSNGHAIAKKRNLTKDEKESIRLFFVRANGIIQADASLKLKETLGRNVTIFQVVGAINGFHRQVRDGVLTVKNMEAYKKNIQARRRLWRTYKSHKYQPKKFPAPVQVKSKPATVKAKV